MGKRKISDFFSKPSTLSENSNEDSVINTPKKRKTNEWVRDGGRSLGGS